MGLEVMQVGRRAAGPVLAAVIALTAATAQPAFAKRPSGGSSASTGYDVSYPQCSSSLPSPVGFAIVGVNDGIVYSANPCLASEFGWASRATATSTTSEAHLSFYANTADPGAAASTHWPSTQTSPENCRDAITTANPNGSPQCDYDYGWNAAQDSFNDAVAVAGSSAAAAAPWWLDVESANSWNDGAGANLADLQGALDFFAAQGITQSGIYTNSSTWSTYFGGNTTMFSGYEAWIPGSGSQRNAVQNCSVTITGGPAYLAQYSSSGLDADYDCR